ncbi:hypothetical protein N9O88_01695, partial [bacterium]|nr:hypothetical protein [bacterium]
MNSTKFILISGVNLMKTFTSLVNLEDHHPDSTVHILINPVLGETLMEWLKTINLNLDIKIVSQKKNLSQFENRFYDLYLIKELIRENRVVVITGSPFIQTSLPLDEFKKDFGGIKTKEDGYSIELCYFNSKALIEEISKDVESKYEKVYMPSLLHIKAYLIQKKWKKYKNKKFDELGLKRRIEQTTKIFHKILVDKYTFSEKKYADYEIENLGFEIAITPDSKNYVMNFNESLFKNKDGFVYYDEKMVRCFFIPEILNQNNNNYDFVIDVQKKLVNTGNNIRNAIMFWKGDRMKIAWCMRSFPAFSARDHYLNNYLLSTLKPDIYQRKFNYDPYINIGLDRVMIYNYPNKRNLTPTVMKAPVLLLGYPMSEEDIDLLKNKHISSYNLLINSPQSIEKLELVKEMKIEKTEKIFSCGGHKNFILEDEDKEKKEYVEYLKKVAGAKYMIVYNDEEYNKCTQLSECMALGTVPI